MLTMQKKFDTDKIHIALGVASHLAIVWAYISIARASADELGNAFDQQVSFERQQTKEVMLREWAWIRWGIAIFSGVLIGITYLLDSCHSRSTAYKLVGMAMPGRKPVSEGNEYMPENSVIQIGSGRRKRVGLNF